MNGLCNNNTPLTYRLTLLQLKYTLLVFTLWSVVIYIIHYDMNLHGWIHLVPTVICCPHRQDVLKQDQHGYKNNP